MMYIVFVEHRSLENPESTSPHGEEAHGPFDDEEQARRFAHWYIWGNEQWRRASVLKLTAPPNNRDDWPTVRKPPTSPEPTFAEDWSNLS